MINEEIIKQQLNNTLEETNFNIGKKYKGKVRDNYILDGKRIMVTTDRISAFDRVLTTLPFKGQLLNQTSNFWFDKTKKIVKNPITDKPDPNVVVVKECRIYPIEMVVRGYLAGSAWRDYKEGKDISGITLPKGMKKSQKLDEPLLTPSTKAETGHDIHISREEIIRKSIINKDVYDEMEEASLKLFDIGTKHCAKQGLILVDTKYEFGDLNGSLVVVDEIHTPDSSRFWYIKTYQELFEKGEDQKMLDKEYVRIWLINHNFMGDGPVPKIPDEVKIEAVKKYITAYELITGLKFKADNKPILERIKNNLMKKGYL